MKDRDREDDRERERDREREYERETNGTNGEERKGKYFHCTVKIAGTDEHDEKAKRSPLPTTTWTPRSEGTGTS